MANAIFDGSDAVMLSGETAAGRYPVESVAMMDRIVREAESHITRFARPHPGAHMTVADAVADLICHASEELNMKVVAVFTESGSTARLISKHRPRPPIIAFSLNQADAPQDFPVLGRAAAHLRAGERRRRHGRARGKAPAGRKAGQARRRGGNRGGNAVRNRRHDQPGEVSRGRRRRRETSKHPRKLNSPSGRDATAARCDACACTLRTCAARGWRFQSERLLRARKNHDPRRRYR